MSEKPNDSMASVAVLVGYCAALGGIAMFSVPWALIIGGVVLFIAGGLATGRSTP